MTSINRNLPIAKKSVIDKNEIVTQVPTPGEAIEEWLEMPDIQEEIEGGCDGDV